MTSVNMRNNRQSIDYLARDYSSFRQALIDLIPEKLPEWTDRSEADFGMVLIELFAHMGDILSYYQDRIANEAFLTTARERRSVISHLRLIGYDMAPAAAATTNLSLIVSNAANQEVTVRKGDRFATPSGKDRKSLSFEYTEEKPLVVALGTAAADSAKKPDLTRFKGFKEIAAVIPVRQGRTITREILGVSDGSPNQRYALSQPKLLRGTLELIVETDPPTPLWRMRKNLILDPGMLSPDAIAALLKNHLPEYLSAVQLQDRLSPTLAFSRGTDADYMIETDENDVTTVIFGDGQFGQIPQKGSRITASYRVGGGVEGNVGAGQITVIADAPQLQQIGAKVVNRSAASGGAERESVENAVKFAPTVFTSMQRAVTAEDYVAQAKLFPGVSKARAEASSWNMVKLFIAPAGAGEPPSDVLKRDLLSFFEDKRMLTCFIDIEDPSYVPIAMEAKIMVLPQYRPEDVLASAEDAVRDLLAFETVDFGQRLYLSKFYESLELIDGISSVFISRFNRAAAEQKIAENGIIALGENEIPVLRTDELTISVGETP